MLEGLQDLGIDIPEVSRLVGVDLSSFPAERLRDLVDRGNLGDEEGVAAIANIGLSKARQLMLHLSEGSSGVKTRSILRTPDSRRLRSDLLFFFASEASSKVARIRLLLQTPNTDTRKIQERLRMAEKGAEIFAELTRQGKLEWVKKELQSVSFPLPKGKDTLKWNQSEIISYFVSRISSIHVLRNILYRCGNIHSLTSLFPGATLALVEKVKSAVDEITSLEAHDPEAIISDAEVEVNDRIRGRVDEDTVRRIVDDAVSNTSTILGMEVSEEERLRKAAFQHLSVPFEFNRAVVAGLLGDWRIRQSRNKANKIKQIEETLAGFRELLRESLEQLVLLDQLLAVATTAHYFNLTIPIIGSEGIGFIEGQNLFLLKDVRDGRVKATQAVSYSVGRLRSLDIAPPSNAVLLTGANSGGKTTLLTTLATIHILTLLGLPVPAQKAEVTPVPIYLFRRKTTRKIGSLEHALSSLIPVFAERKRKLILIDEIEALTEPGAAGRIIATLLTRSASTSSLLLLVTHLARETMPHVKLPIRIDGIEAKGLNEQGLDVDRQPRFNHVGSSTPKLILMKLVRETRDKKARALYSEVLASLQAEKSSPTQMPLNIPWLQKPGSQKKRIS